MKQVYNPPIEIKEIASIYESESIGDKIYVYRRLSKNEIRNYYTGKSNLEPDEQGRIFLFSRDTIEEVKTEINSYWRAIEELLKNSPSNN